MKEQFEEAQKEFEVSEKLAPSRSLPYVALALLWLQMNRPERRRYATRPGSPISQLFPLWYLGEALNRS